MPWIAAGAIVGGSVISGALGANAAGKAAGQQAAATDRATAESRRQFDVTQSNMAPYLRSGNAANVKLSALLGLPDTTSGGAVTYNGQQYDNLNALRTALEQDYTKQTGLAPTDPQIQTSIQSVLNRATPVSAQSTDTQSSPLLRKFTADDLAADPVYNSGLKFGMDEGRKAIEARNVANGSGYDSSATLRQIVRYANDYGTTKANDSYNRFVNDQSNIYGRLSGQSGSGQVATTNLGNLGATTSGAIGQDLVGAGNARAAGIVGGANAWGGALSGIGNAAGNYQNSMLLKSLIAKNSGGGGGGTPYGVSAPDYGYYDF